MFDVKNIPVVGKFLLIIAVFGAFSVASAVYSTSRMRHIDDNYSALIEHADYGTTFLTRASRSLNKAALSIADLLIANTEAGNREAEESLAAGRADLLENIAKAKAGLPDFAADIDALQARSLSLIDQTCAKAIKMGRETTDAGGIIASQAEYLANCHPPLGSIQADMAALGDKAMKASAKHSDDLTAVTDHTIVLTYAGVLGGLALVALLSYFSMSAWIVRPLKRLAASMQALANGDLIAALDGVERKDEIGPMAQAVQVFKDNGLKLQAADAAAAGQRLAGEQDRAANEAARAEIQRQQQAVVAAIASGLERLSKGDLTGRLNQVFAEEYEKLRADFNATAESLQDALRTITTATSGISTGSDQIAHASDDLSRRTEQQAASLEETAAALNVITDTVRTMAANAGAAAKVVITTRSAAESSGAIVQQAVDAMGKIKESSQQITNIIGVIDEIAFQTNLLALNAGVEAARAGDAGRGFAVVASEVRGLAQRSAEAAKEIKALISASTVQVESGVVLVDKTGVALKEIIVRVAEMDGLVRQISAASQEQATGLAEINTAVSQMDQVVQQNAAMVEESTAAAHALKAETQDLTTMVGRFDIGEDRQAGARGRGNPVHAAQAKLAKSITRPAARPMLKATGSAAHKAAAPEKDWEEF